jgi:nucleoside-diphosphate-sugar epimerase
MRAYLITGASGFIGSQVAEALLRQGHTVHGVDNLGDSYNPAYKRWRLDRLLTFGAFHFTLGDIEDTTFSATAADGGSLDGVIHLAARGGVRTSVDNPDACFRTNVGGTLHVLELCRKLRVPKLVVASSSSVYGAGNPMPYVESADTSRPISPYGASKKAVEEVCFTYHHLYGTDVSVLRLFTVYGPSGRPDMSMFRFVRAIVEGSRLTLFGDGNQVRDFSYVDDIVRGVLSALQPAGYRIFNLGASHPVKLGFVIASIERLSGRTAVIECRAADPSEPSATWADVSRAKAELAWEPYTTPEDGIRQTLDWYLQNREWASRI